MEIYALKGHKVRFTGNNGYDSENEFARKHLEIGGVYIVDHTDVGQSSTSVFLEGITRTAFDGQEILQSWNSVMFEDVEPQSKKDTEKHPNYKMWNK